MSNKRVILISALAAVLVLAAVGCDGDGGGNDPVTPPPGGDGTVVVSAGAGTFYGFDVVLDYPESLVAPISPLADAIVGSGIGTGLTCEEQQVGTTLRYSCVSATAVTGPAALATFKFEFDNRPPVAGEFALTCDFVDQDGRPVDRTCTMALDF